ncbi:hypothetical protein [Paenibacillus sp. Mc5Re-14]|uniref:hypothetical protein n=1 Tax=Paenibacillus sp. Mc5Re-14 TaxID=1030529 RepID=UPI000B0F48CF|nr:hypothetical protein [Paenibacillus sp. Mc5Re-14]
MNEIKRGQMVKVVDTGETYSTYTDMFNHMRAKLGFADFTHARGLQPEKDKVYMVLAVEKHFNNNDSVALIHNDNQKGYLISIDGLELI